LPDTWTEKIRVTDIVTRGIVIGEYFEPQDEIFRSYCTSA
jgi:hypothetical protein